MYHLTKHHTTFRWTNCTASRVPIGNVFISNYHPQRQLPDQENKKRIGETLTWQLSLFRAWRLVPVPQKPNRTQKINNLRWLPHLGLILLSGRQYPPFPSPHAANWVISPPHDTAAALQTPKNIKNKRKAMQRRNLF